MDGRLPVERVTPAPRERKGVEVRFDLLQELVRGGGGHLPHPDEPVDVPSLATLDLPPAVRRERRDREGVAGLNHVPTEAADVRDGLPRMEFVLLDRVAREVRDRLEAVALDHTLDRGPQKPGRRLRTAHLDRG